MFSWCFCDKSHRWNTPDFVSWPLFMDLILVGLSPLKENLWDDWIRYFASQMSFCCPTDSLEALKRTHELRALIQPLVSSFLCPPNWLLMPQKSCHSLYAGSSSQVHTDTNVSLIFLIKCQILVIPLSVDTMCFTANKGVIQYCVLCFAVWIKDSNWNTDKNNTFWN